MTVVDWLLESDPAIRWQVKRDLIDAPADEVGAERARIATEGWGVRLLRLQHPTGYWVGDRAYFPNYTSTHATLMILRELGLEPESAAGRRAIGIVHGNARLEYDDLPYFDGEVEPCINGSIVAIGAYFGVDVRAIVDRLVGEQMEDGGWNCEQERGSVRGSFDSTIHVLEGLLEYERAAGGSPEVANARRRGEAYLLERSLLRRKTTGEVVSPRMQYLFPPTPRYLYDFLRGLDYFRAAGLAPDERMTEAMALLESKRDVEGRWPVEYKYDGDYHFEMDDAEGQPSRWNTLRALRVLRWWEAANPGV